MENARVKKLYTTHEVAKMLGVTPITVIRWIDSGKFKCFTTVGGHRRIEHDELVRFAQEYNLPWQGDDQLKERKEFVVLAVDDEPDLLEMIEEMCLGMQGVRVIKAANGFAAGARLVEDRPDLVLLDFMMPELDGFDFTRFVRQDPRFKDVPIIAVTALKSSIDLVRVKEVGVTDIVPKPFSFDDIQRTVRHYQSLKNGTSNHKAA